MISQSVVDHSDPETSWLLFLFRYSMRKELDPEEFLEQFLIVNGHTALSHVIWNVEATSNLESLSRICLFSGRAMILSSVVW